MSTVILTDVPTRARWPAGALALAALLLLTVLPFALADIPAMVDYPNHLARMSVLARAGTATPHPYFEVAFAAYPNLAMDLIVPPFARLVGVEAATRMFLLLAQALVVAGAMTLGLAVKGRALASGLAAALSLHAMPFAFGFLNFQFALGIALFALAAWMSLAARSVALRLLVHAVAVTILYVSHLFALGLYGIAIGVVELWRWHRDRPPLARVAALFLGMAAPAVAVGGLAMAAGGSVGGTGTVWSAGWKVAWLGFLSGWNDGYGAVAGEFIAIPLILAAKRGHLRFVGPGRWLAIAFAALFLATPSRLFDTGFVDGRVLVAALLILPAFVRLDAPAGLRRALLGIAAAVGLGNAALAAYVQIAYAAEYKDLIRGFEAMPRGSRLLPADAGDGGDPPANLMDYPRMHASTLAVYTRDAFVPTLFAFPGKQPIVAVPAVAPIKLLEGGPISWALLERYAAGAEPPPFFAYVRNWTADFDYLLLQNPPGDDPRPDLLEKVASGRHFALYRILTRGRPEAHRHPRTSGASTP